MRSFEDFVSLSNRATSPAELFDIFHRATSKMGYDKVLFALLSDHIDIDLKAGIGVIENFPEDWMKYYFEKGLDRIDPIATYAIHQSDAFEWCTVRNEVRLTQKQLTCLNMGAEAGLRHGVGIPLKGPRGQIAGISLASSEKRDCPLFDKDLITAHCNQFYLAYRRLHKPKRTSLENIVLTPRERDVLCWAATGKSDREIAECSNMGPHSVNMHMRGLFSKLQVNNRIALVTRAISYGLISI